MTVQDLILLLEKEDPDANVYIERLHHSDSSTWTTEEDPTVKRQSDGSICLNDDGYAKW